MIEFNSPLPQLRPNQLMDIPEEAIHRHNLEFRFRRTGEPKEVLHDPFQAVNLALDRVQVFLLAAAGLLTRFQSEKPDLDRCDRVSTLVRDSSGENAQRGEFL